MTEFIFMLTHDDETVANPLAVYEQVRSSDLRWVGFKDVGRPESELAELAARIRSDGRKVVMEVVSLSESDEVASINAALRIGVDVLMGGTRVRSALPLLAGRSIHYLPFPGSVSGHPSILEGTVDEIVASALRLAGTDGVAGLDLLAYRFTGDVPVLLRGVIGAAPVPIVVAGSIDSLGRLGAVAQAGAWGFTVGSAIFEKAFRPGGTIRDQIEVVLRATRSVGTNSKHSLPNMVGQT